MRKHMYRARRRMNHVVSELSHALLLAGGSEIDMRLIREEGGLRLYLEGNFDPEHQRGMERVARLLQPAVRDPALVGQMVDESRVVVETGRVRMNLFLAF